MQSKGIMIFTAGIILLLITLIWIYIDNKNKDKKEANLLRKATTINSYTNNDSRQLLYGETEKMNYSTELLLNSTELLDDTELI